MYVDLNSHSKLPFGRPLLCIAMFTQCLLSSGLNLYRMLYNTPNSYYSYFGLPSICPSFLKDASLFLPESYMCVCVCVCVQYKVLTKDFQEFIQV